MNHRQNETHTKEIIEFGGEVVRNCRFTDCEFVGLASQLIDCTFVGCGLPAPFSGRMSGCVFLAKPITVWQRIKIRFGMLRPPAVMDGWYVTTGEVQRPTEFDSVN